MPFGLKNAAQTFHRLMDTIFGDLPFVYIYIDDVLIASSSNKAHKKHLEIVRERIQQHGLTVNVDKCIYNQSTISFLGHQISDKGIAPLPSKKQAITEFPKPDTVRSMQCFLGIDCKLLSQISPHGFASNGTFISYDSQT